MAVRWALVGARTREDEASPDATLMDDLGAESIDLLDILFRIEREHRREDRRRRTSATTSRAAFRTTSSATTNGIITAKGLEHLKTVMPQIDTRSPASSRPTT